MTRLLRGAADIAATTTTTAANLKCREFMWGGRLKE